MNAFWRLFDVTSKIQLPYHYIFAWTFASITVKLTHQLNLYLFAITNMPKALLSLFLYLTFSLLLWASDSLQSAYASAAGIAAMSSSDCLSCHQDQSDKWKKSDHYMAMADANNQSENAVLGNFDAQTALHFNQKVEFFIRDNKYMARVYDDIENQPEDSETFEIKYTFGHYPLQQYLVETEAKRFQVLPFAWDSRPIGEGGQRWYHLHSEQAISANDRLHWRQALQNWNGMCADCHSDELVRNYDVKADTFDTQFSGINVGCVSCHGTMNGHLKDGVYQSSNQNSNDYLFMQSMPLNTEGAWRITEDADTAIWSGQQRDNSFMDTCYACHSLRKPLSDGFTPSKSFLNQFSPSLIIDPLYHADGQIKEEVYVYGSFLQSKMYQKGVNCLDCHDPHTMKLKVEGNGLCLQCHKASEFETPKHHRHEAFSEGAQCINCHMPKTNYMGVDARGDHSFKIPRPDLSVEFGTPNACETCHQDQDANWASKKLIEWHGQADTLSSSRKSLIALRSGSQIGLDEHFAIIEDTSLDAISRASALEMLSRSTQNLESSQLSRYIASNDDLIRIAAIKASNLVAPNQRASLLSSALSDPLKAVRTEAAQVLVGVSLPKADIEKFSAAFAELTVANETSAWRGEGRINIGINKYAQGDLIGAEQAFKASTKIEPHFAPGYVNLADLYRAKQREDLVDAFLNQGMKNNPQSADIPYSYGLHYVRQKQLAKGIELFKTALDLDPSNPQFAYAYVLAIDSAGQSGKALSILKQLIVQYQNKTDLKELGLYLAQKNRSNTDMLYFRSL